MDREGGYNFVDYAHPEFENPISLQNILKDRPLLDKLTSMNATIPHAIGEIISSAIIKQDIYVSKQQDSIANLSVKEDVIFTYRSFVGFGKAMNDKSNYLKLQYPTFVFSLNKRDIKRFTKEEVHYKSVIRKNEKHSDHYIWPLNDSNEFVIGFLTKKSVCPRTLLSLITDFNHETKCNLTI